MSDQHNKNMKDIPSSEKTSLCHNKPETRFSEHGACPFFHMSIKEDQNVTAFLGAYLTNCLKTAHA